MPAELEPISPELALIDPELARRARSKLPDVYSVGSFGAPAGAVAAPGSEPGRRVVGPFPSRRSHHAEVPPRRERPSTLRYVAAAAVLALSLAALGGETYLWTASVRAGGTQSSPPPPAAPPPGAPAAPTARIFTWPPAPGAVAYRFGLYRGGTGVLVARTREPRFELTGRWRYRGRWYVLVRGPYLWVVTPLRPAAAGLRAGPPIVRATYEFAG